MAPRFRRVWPDGFSADQIRHAAALLLIFPVARRTHLVATVRAGTLGRHGGQVSLPGGVVEAGESLEDAALREAHEEIALDAGGVRCLGRLTPVDIVVSGFRLHPVLAAAPGRPALRPTDGEVERILEIPLDTLMADETVVWRSFVRDGEVVHFPAFPVESADIWGATAMVLAEFLALCGWAGPSNVDRS